MPVQAHTLDDLQQTIQRFIKTQTVVEKMRDLILFAKDYRESMEDEKPHSKESTIRRYAQELLEIPASTSLRLTVPEMLAILPLRLRTKEREAAQLREQLSHLGLEIDFTKGVLQYPFLESLNNVMRGERPIPRDFRGLSDVAMINGPLVDPRDTAEMIKKGC